MGSRESPKNVITSTTGSVCTSVYLPAAISPDHKPSPFPFTLGAYPLAKPGSAAPKVVSHGYESVAIDGATT